MQGEDEEEEEERGQKRSSSKSLSSPKVHLVDGGCGRQDAAAAAVLLSVQSSANWLRRIIASYSSKDDER